MNMMKTSGLLPQVISTTLQGVDTIVEVLKKWRQYRISDITTLKMLYLELDRYMELIEVGELKYFLRHTAPLDTFFSLIKKIDLTVTALVLARQEEYSVFKKMMKRGSLTGRLFRPVLRKEKRRAYENVLQALSFIYTKTAVLKQIAETGDQALFREMKIKERLHHIAESIAIVMKVLVTFRGVNVIARRWHR
ncbi:MAG TPA: hypothetical protein ENN69_01420, partial [Spirochaetia bacterium]|nr:hypothetical protein [Spirochaetia bacterium]